MTSEVCNIQNSNATTVNNSGITNDNQQPGSSSASTSTCCVNHTKLQALKLKKIDLEKKLNEKNILLAQIIRDENNIVKLASENTLILGQLPAPTNIKLLPSNLPPNNISLQSLRRKVVGTSFKLPENLLNYRNDDINKMLLDKKIQQQISEASLKLSNDLTQRKSIRRAHKQYYDIAQEKLKSIEKKLLILQQNKLINIDDVLLDCDQLGFDHQSSGNLQQNENMVNRNYNSGASKIIRHNSMKITSPNSIESGLKSQTSLHHRLIRHNSDYHHQSVGGSSAGRLSPSKHYLSMPSSSTNQYHPPTYYTSRTKNNVKIKMPIATPPTASFVTSNNMDDVDEVTTSLEQYYSQHCQNQIENHYRIQNEQSSNADLNQIIQLTQQGLGGYWLSLENNEKIWCSVDTRFSSLDRKNNHIMKLNKNTSNISPQPTKSASLGNFDFLTKCDEFSDSISVSSITSENKKTKEKIWSETSLDSPTSNVKQHSFLSSSPSTLQQSYSPQHQRYRHAHHNVPHSSINNIGSATIPAASTNILNYPHNVNNNSYDEFDSTIENIDRNSINDDENDTNDSNNNPPANNPDIRIESPKNMTIVQEAKFRPYKEISKPFEMSDFYKYSTKYRQKVNVDNFKNVDDDEFSVVDCSNDSNLLLMEENNFVSETNLKHKSNNLDNSTTTTAHPIQKVYYQPPNPSICQPINYR